MPELPEVETVRRSLLKPLLDTEIESVEIIAQSVIETKNPQAFQKLGGVKFIQLARRGKYLIFYLSNNQVMVVHLRMTGRLLYHAKAEELAKHSHVRISLAGGAELIFADTRRFGRLWLVDQDKLDEVSGLNSLALEPLDPNFSVEYWQNNIARKGRSMAKAVLLDQHIVAGLGNIYADEVLFAAGVHPERLAKTLTDEENRKLCQAMAEVLTKSIELRGTTFRDYVDGNNEKGSFQNHLQIFMKVGQPCPVCGETVQKIKVVGRSSYFCPNCQKNNT